MKPDTWMPFYIGDYLRDTLGLSRAEHGSYVLLIMAYWTNGGPLHDDNDCLREIAKCPPHEWARTRGLMMRFFTNGDGLWRHKRIDAELAEAKKTYETRMAKVEAMNTARESCKDSCKDSCKSTTKPPPSNVVVIGTPVPIEGGVGETDVEPPRGFPASEQAAIEQAGMIGVPAEIVSTAYNLAVARGYRDARDVPIRSWQHHIKAVSAMDADRKARMPATHLSAASAADVARRQKIEKLKAEIARA